MHSMASVHIQTQSEPQAETGVQANLQPSTQIPLDIERKLQLMEKSQHDMQK